MDRLAVGEAISAGFRLVSREPLIFAGWLATDFLVSVFPSALMQASGAGANPAAAAAFLPLLLLFSCGLSAVLGGAVFRAVFKPDDRRSLYLRLGPQEGWLAVALLALTAVQIVALTGAMMVMGLALSLVLGAGAPGGAPAGPALVMGLALVYGVLAALAVWLFARLGLALPTAFQTRRLRLAEAWRRSAPESRRIFAVLALLSALTGLAYAVIVGTMLWQVNGVIPLEQLSAQVQHDPQVLAKALNPNSITAMGLLLLIVGGIARVAFFGAWADISRQLGVGGEAIEGPAALDEA